MIKHLFYKVFAFVLLSVVFLNFPQKAEAVKFYWDTPQTVDSTGAVGAFSSIEVDSLGKSYISYQDSTNGDVKYATNATGAWVLQTADATGVGPTSIGLDINKKAYVVYRNDFINGHLKYATNASGAWVTQTVDSSSLNGFPSLAMGGANKDKAYISYYDATNANLEYATNASGSWVLEIVDATDSVGRYTSIALDSNDLAYISYEDLTSADLNFATHANGSSNIQTVDSTVAVQHTSIALDGNNKSYISYYDPPGADLEYATNASGSWVLQTVDSPGDVGESSSIALDSSKKAYISYYDFSNDKLKFATNASGSWVTQTVTGPAGSTSAGPSISLALDSSGNAYISFFDDTNDDLKYVFGERGNLVADGVTDVVNFDGGSGSPGGITATANATADGRVRKLNFNNEAAFTASSLVGDMFSMFEFKIDDATYAGDIQFTVNYTPILSLPDFIAAGWSESDLQIFHIPASGPNTGVVQQLAITRNLAANTITGTIPNADGLSPFGIGVNPEPATLLLLAAALFGLLPLRKKLF